MWIKICGMRDVQAALDVANLRPQAIGLNFYRKSARVVQPDVAAEIVQKLPATTTPVGVFVNHTLAEIREICRECRLTMVQLHGDEPPEFLAELNPLQVIRAYRLGDQGLRPLGEYLDRCRTLGALPIACLIDSHAEGVYGGSGRTAAWNVVERDYPLQTWPPLILAGGLHPGNVSAAIRAVNPWGVDVASGVEASPGVKDPVLVQNFIANAAAHR